MISSDKKRFAKIMALVGELYSKQISPELMKIHWNALIEYPIDDVDRGYQRHMQDPDSGQFLPKPADVIRHIGGNTQSQALLAWAKLEKALGSVGHMSSVVFDDPIIHAIVSDMGGWVQMCSTDEKEIPFKRVQFEKLYRAYKGKDSFDYPKKLIGVAEHQNVQSGFSADPPVLIGEETRALQVLESGTQGSGLRITRVSRDSIKQLEHQQ